MNRFYSWSMKGGSKILFWSAVISFVATMWSQFSLLMTNFREMASNHGSDMMPYFTTEPSFATIAAALITFSFLFFAAVVVHRLDRWLAIKEAAE